VYTKDRIYAGADENVMKDKFYRSKKVMKSIRSTLGKVRKKRVGEKHTYVQGWGEQL